MTMISCSRMGFLAAVLVASLGAAACDSQGCGQVEEETTTSQPTVTCGPGTRLVAGQCVVITPVQTR